MHFDRFVESTFLLRLYTCCLRQIDLETVGNRRGTFDVLSDRGINHNSEVDQTIALNGNEISL